ncbi:MAG TPA: GMC family oxidoreductase N-terminal domain-containing protein, partial [Thermomicrobiales bacterium]|nr:GMC family oxidoreductase N-terminal domain-containing protein [Thermomicrobiales bacterium]
MSSEFDYIVVGAGSAGCIVASRLSEDPAVTVALIEAGSPPEGRLFSVPSQWSRQFTTQWDWDYNSEPEPELHDRRNYLPRGKTIGGTGAMNGMLYVRGVPQDFDDWEAAGNPGWGWDDVLPIFLRSENNQRGESAFHATGG